ncbi:hypothetical protein B296_00008877 [Ensete ventricosum]|uniref:Uncharacterized protein n=1 Tax=Ensete ventricosum TaxID=4639 RepID=A0A426YW73_ENSVE|nr:hypothetical protein B296_00008877 [Ensete ventricosum]
MTFSVPKVLINRASDREYDVQSNRCDLRPTYPTVKMTSRNFSSLSFFGSSVESVTWTLDTVEAVNSGPQVVGRPSGSPRVEVVSLSSRGAIPTDSKVLKAMMVMQSCYNNDSTMTVRRLAKVQKHFCIPVEYESMSHFLGSVLIAGYRSQGKQAPLVGATARRGSACGHGRLRPARRGGSRPRAHPLIARRPQRGPTAGRSQGWPPLSRVATDGQGQPPLALGQQRWQRRWGKRGYGILMRKG